MDKCLWIICSNKELLEILSDCKQEIGRVIATKRGCPPRKDKCGKIYDHGCAECWMNWLDEHAEVVSDE